MSSQILTAQDLAAESISPLQQAGTFNTDYLGRTWAYVQASEALSQGDAVTITNSTSTYIGANTAVTTNQSAVGRTVTASTIFTNTYQTGVVYMMAAPLEKDASGNLIAHPNGHVYWFWVDADAADGTEGQGGPIVKRNDANSVDVYFVNSSTGKSATALTTNSNFLTLTTTRVKKAADTAGESQIGGFVQRQGGVTDEYWFWALVKGYGVATHDLSTAIVPGKTIQAPGDASGKIIGTTDSDTSELPYMGGVGLMTIADADGLVPILADCREVLRSLPRAPADLDAAYPAQINQ
jgi:hypothetical protein